MTMTVIETGGRGGPPVLRVGERPVPAPSRGEVVISVRAAGVNRPDLLQRQGLYPPPPGASDVLGLEVAGVVAARGEGVTSWREGDEVMALLPGGGYASHAICDARHVLPKPPGLSFDEAAGFCETAFTVWANAVEAGALRPGERLLVHGATSGIGTMAGKMAAALGAQAWGTAGTPAKVAAALAHSYARCWDYRQEDWSVGARDAGGVDVVLDMVGGDYLARNVAALREGGRHVSIAFLRGTEGTLDLLAVMRRRLILTGSTLRARPPEEKARLTREVRTHLLPHLADGRLTPVIDRVFPLSEAAAAHAHLEAGEHVGKVILRV